MRDDEVSEVISKILFDRMGEDKHTIDRIDESLVLSIVNEAAKLMKKENFAINLSGDFVVIGDIHGNVDDLIRIFETQGYPPKTSYILLGDYVDRGCYSLEVLMFLYSMKIKFPQNIYLLRGNHETASVTKMYGFRDDCVYRLNNNVYKRFIKSFGRMPVVAIVNGQFICVHGGISPKIHTISEMYDFEKQTKVSGDITDLLWSDPSPNVKNFSHSERNLGHKFGQQALQTFLNENNLKMLIRGHSYCENGFRYDFGEEGGCLTVFSSCNYSGRHNPASIALINNETSKVTIKTFESIKGGFNSHRRICLPEWIIESHQKRFESTFYYEEVDDQLLPFNITFSLIE